jgi:hypothetical protein
MCLYYIYNDKYKKTEKVRIRRGENF